YHDFVTLSSRFDRSAVTSPPHGPPGFRALMSPAPPAATSAHRQRWLSILAKAPVGRLEALWQTIDAVPPYTVVRRPEIGLVMVEGRIAGTGAPFPAGEMTVTRAAVRLQSGELGIGYVGGRAPRQAEIAALVDALGQRPDWQAHLEERVI